jgi:hypothetical protein
LTGVGVFNGSEIRQSMLPAHPDAAIDQNARGTDFDYRAARADLISSTKEGYIHGE